MKIEGCELTKIENIYVSTHVPCLRLKSNCFCYYFNNLTENVCFFLFILEKKFGGNTKKCKIYFHYIIMIFFLRKTIENIYVYTSSSAYFVSRSILTVIYRRRRKKMYNIIFLYIYKFCINILDRVILRTFCKLQVPTVY